MAQPHIYLKVTLSSKPKYKTVPTFAIKLINQNLKQF